MLHRVRYPVLLCAITLSWAGCGSTDRSPRAAGPSREPQLVAASADRIRNVVRRPGATAVVVNVWATWCTPCRQEFPDLMRLDREYRARGLRLVLVSSDFEDQAHEARRFLARQGVDFASYLKTGNDMEFINGLDPRWTGALPATFVYDGHGTLRNFHEGRTTFAALERQVVAAMNGLDSPETSVGDSIGKETAP